MFEEKVGKLVEELRIPNGGDHFTLISYVNFEYKKHYWLCDATLEELAPLIKLFQDRSSEATVVLNSFNICEKLIQILFSFNLDEIHFINNTSIYGPIEYPCFDKLSTVTLVNNEDNFIFELFHNKNFIQTFKGKLNYK